ncbi:sugar kinase [Cryobacterium sp. TMT2-10]|uniref:Sugar kinase n=1 Tax=Cryobacterium shii TaxID=1259235 RepID=A0AAQ2C6R3_9MICO|nr:MULTISPECIES: PfkB family carbohydrate kinase [Cryobacterium]TFC48616.1 sugar kinase [Cryobacterium shii]TFC86635.1 sugar kinase [Cryobacterium sp. TmT2-59]TFD15617.1 sugar kinase [Cryobacterium sp. TMT4-10]TFD26962.1 sugar kinase [Cryobacterium sp. TMT2-23]TFD39602.1 sugar kinase [Cryobacterium sp. TMT2-10]
MPQTHRVVVVGDALIDEMRDPESLREFPGGAALNVAVGLAVLGVPTTLIAMVGGDAAGAVLRDFLASHDVTLVATPGPFGSSRATSDRTDGEPTYAFNEAAKKRRIEFGPAERAALDAARLVVVSCFPFDDTAQTDAFIAAVSEPEQRLVIDPNPRAGMLADADLFVANFERMAARSLLTKVGDEDAELLYRSTLDDLRRRLLAAGTQTVLATAGRAGASVGTRDGLLVSEPITSLPGAVVDTMGAGDATLASTVQTMLTRGVPTDAAGWQSLLADAMLIAAATCRSEGGLLRVPTA